MPDPLHGLDAVDWASLTHAYGDAGDVPVLLRALAGDDPRERANALDALYGGVHHQGDVYNSTLACLPFLLALAGDPAVADRASVLYLLASIGESADAAIEHAWDGMPDPHTVIAAHDGEDDWWEELAVAYGLLAGDVLRERVPLLARLFDDPDPAVRAAAIGLLARRHPQPPAVLDPLIARAAVEQDGAVRHALAGAFGELLGRSPESGRATEGLLRLAAPGGDPGTVLTALAELARHTPEQLPADLVERATAALDDAQQRGSSPAAPPLPDDDTLSSHLRRLRATEFEDATDERAAEALADLHLALGDRVTDRHRLVLHALRHGDPQSRADAVERAGDLHSGWRVPGAEATAELLAALVTATDPAVSAAETATAAARELRLCALPLTPALLDAAAAVAEAGEYRTSWGWERGLPGQCLQLLVAAGDRRAATLLARLLPGREGPEELPAWCARLAAHAADLIPTLVPHLSWTNAKSDTTPGVFDHAGVTASCRVLAALQACLPGSGALIAPVLEEFRKELPKTGGTLHPAALLLLARPDDLGREAEEAEEAAEVVPVLRLLLTDPKPATRAVIARALWHAGLDPAELWPVLAELLADQQAWYARQLALDLLAAMGPAAAPLAEPLRACLTDDSDQITARAALALRAAGLADGPQSAQLLDRTLATAWTGTRAVRPVIAAGLRRAAAAGQPLPGGLRDLLAMEAAEVRRLGNDGAPRPGMRYDCAADEELRADCAELLALLG